MTERFVVPIVAIALLFTGCKSREGCPSGQILCDGACVYSPTGQCSAQCADGIAQPLELANGTTADILFVVDDSGSMAAEQAELATQFNVFTGVLANANRDRLAEGLNPVDFHVAVTTTSSYYNEPTLNGSVCSNGCPGAQGQYVCCLEDASGALTGPQPPLCASDGDCSGPTYGCTSACAGILDVAFYTPTACCDATGAPQRIACDAPGAPCGIFDRFYYQDGVCTPGYAGSGPYPAGHFLADPANGTAFPATPAAQGKVLHFDRSLDWASWAWTAPGSWGGTSQSLRDLAGAFARNVAVGTCGSPQEQGLETARRAVMGQLGQGGLSQPGVTRAEWLHDGATLIVVWVSDEDDCSAPWGAAEGVVYPVTSDGCRADSELPADQQRQYPVAEYADYFGSLGRPFAAAFVVSANAGCSGAACFPMICTDAGCTGDPWSCGGQGIPSRYLGLADELRARGVRVAAGSICDPFGGPLGQVAQFAKPPAMLQLATAPAPGELTVLRIVRGDGTPRITCVGPAPEGLDAAGAAAAGYDWWFTAIQEQITPAQRDPSGASRYLFVDFATSDCVAQPGERYEALLVPQRPAGGCTDAASCATALGGRASDWSCVMVNGLGRCTCP